MLKTEFNLSYGLFVAVMNMSEIVLQQDNFSYYHIKSLHSYIIVTWVCGEGTVGQYGLGEVFVRPTMAT